MSLDELFEKVKTARKLWGGDIRVGYTGHYGELYDLDEDEVKARVVDIVEYSSGKRTFRTERVFVLADVPNVGPEPD